MRGSAPPALHRSRLSEFRGPNLNPEWFSVWEPAITTFAPALGEMGEFAAQVLLKQMTGGEPGTGVHRVPGQLRVRDTIPPRTLN